MPTYDKKRYATDPEYANQIKDGARKYRHKMRYLAMLALGGVCVQCGYDNPRALEFDHVNNDGSKDRRSGTKSDSYNRVQIHKAIAAGERDDIQLLCANCHRIKTFTVSSAVDYYDEFQETIP